MMIVWILLEARYFEQLQELLQLNLVSMGSNRYYMIGSLVVGALVF